MSPELRDNRFPRSVYGRGVEPDARFTLANERTFLAWVSTGLALISVGVGVKSIALDLQPELRVAAALVLVVSGAICPVHAWFGWCRVEAAMREGRPLPSSSMMPFLAVSLGIAGAVILLAMVRG